LIQTAEGQLFVGYGPPHVYPVVLESYRGLEKALLEVADLFDQGEEPGNLF